MSGQQYNYNMWEDDGWSASDPNYNANEMVVNTDQFNFHQSEYYEQGAPVTQIYNDNYSAKMSFFYDQPQMPENNGQGKMTQMEYNKNNSTYGNPNANYEFDEPPLLEELEIFPDQIAKRVMVVLDPFKSTVPCDYDLGGPLFFCLCLAFTMLLSGGKVNFGYVYGIGVTSCLLMYLLLILMTDSDKISFMAVTSVLGYSLLPVVLLSCIAIFFSLRNSFGYCLAVLSVGWASIAASKVFCTMSGDTSQRPLITYPCALLYGVFTLLVIF